MLTSLLLVPRGITLSYHQPADHSKSAKFNGSSQEVRVFTGILTIIGFLTGLSIGRWLYPSEAALLRRRGAEQRERERPEHDHERARQIAEIQSELSKVRGMTGTGA